jgi:hypothetical protein
VSTRVIYHINLYWSCVTASFVSKDRRLQIWYWIFSCILPRKKFILSITFISDASISRVTLSELIYLAYMPVNCTCFPNHLPWSCRSRSSLSKYLNIAQHMYLVSTSRQLIHEIPRDQVFRISLKPRFRSLLKMELGIHHSDGGERYLFRLLAPTHS